MQDTQDLTEYDPDELIREHAINSASAKHGVSPNLVKKVIRAEGSASNATSPKGAQGLMQLMPDIQKKYGVKDPSNDLQNINAGTQYLADLKKQYSIKYPKLSDSQVEQAVIAHYNGGTSQGNLVAQGKAPSYPETQNYLNNTQQDLTEYDPDQLIAEYNNKVTSDKNKTNYALDYGLDKYSSSQKPITHTPKEEAIGATPVNVAMDSAIRTATAGFVQPKWATKEEIEQNPVSSLIGGGIGYTPYALLSGGLPVAMGVSGLHSVTQTANEGGTAGDIALAGALGTAAPGVGKLLGKPIKYAGQKIANALGGGVTEGERQTVNAAAIELENRINKTKAELTKQGFSQEEIDSAIKGTFGPDAIPSFRKNFMNKIQDAVDVSEANRLKSLTGYGKNVLHEAIQDTIGGATAGSAIAFFTGQDPLKGAIGGGALINAKNAASAATKVLLKDPEFIRLSANYLGSKVAKSDLTADLANTIVKYASPADFTSAVQYSRLVGNSMRKVLANQKTPVKVIEERALKAEETAFNDFNRLINKANKNPADVRAKLSGAATNAAIPWMMQRKK